ncbi:MAG TPA: mannonate dehydratase [Chthonomonadaceae bacterium]|nr:mannonate dehydratase [Chthonomonadaceae bacterium]
MPQIKIAHRMSSRPSAKELAFFQQMGIEAATIWTTMEDANYEYMVETRRTLESHGILLWNIGIIDLHCDPTMVLGLPGFEQKVAQYKAYLRNLGRAGIGYTTYAHMANIKMLPYYQTAVGTTRGGIPTREFDLEIAKNQPLSHDRVYTEDEIWETFTAFIREVIPVAEEAGVRIGLHPDDPPVPSLGGVARIFSHFEGYRRATEIASSPNFGLCLCVGSWAEGGAAVGKDVLGMIDYFGQQGKLFKIHFRNVDAPLPKFRETLVDDGYVDMYEVMKALHRVGFDGVLLPDHVPGDGLEGIHTAYTIGYMRALRSQVCAQTA